MNFEALIDFFKKTSITHKNNFDKKISNILKRKNRLSSFRSLPVMVETIEHVRFKDSQTMMDLILKHPDNIAKAFSKFQNSEAVGAPKTFAYGEYSFAPTTIRYIQVLSELISLFGDLRGYNIVEIGGGYGGQCKIITDYFEVSSYTILDLKSVADLANYYLSQFQKLSSNIKATTLKEISGRFSCDLLISNYAFSELSLAVQKKYLKEVILKSPKGYMRLNHLGFGNDAIDSLNYETLLSQLPNVKITDEYPQTAGSNIILTWNSL